MRTLKSTILAILAVAMVTSALCLSLYRWDNKYTHSGSQAISGALIVRQTDWTQTPIRYLWNGWNFYPDTLLTPQTYDQRNQNQVMSVQVGQYNNFAFGQAQRPTDGCGTYVLTLVLPQQVHTYALEIPEIFSAYALYLDDDLLASQGNLSPQRHGAQLQNRVVTFPAAGTTRLLLAVQDEGHLYSGMVYPPAFGEPQAVQTVRDIRIARSAGTIAAALLFAMLALWLSVRGYGKQSHSWIFFLLCLFVAIFVSYSTVHAIIPMGTGVWYLLELLSGHIITLLVVVLHNRACQVRREFATISTAMAGGFCILVALYGMGIFGASQAVAAAFSAGIVAFKVLTTIYLLLSACRAAYQRQHRIAALFYAELLYAIVFFWDCMLPSYEPIYGGWFQEWSCLILVGVLGVIYWQDIAQGYERSLTLVEEQRQIQRQLEMQQGHFQQITEQVEHARRQRHDFRQHLRVIAALAGNEPEQAAYIGEITALDEWSDPITYCHDSATNALLHYYAGCAQARNIDLSIQVELPDDAAIPSVAFCTILGNLIENAVEACARQATADRYIHLHIRGQFGNLYVRLDNSYDGDIQRQKGALLSRKHGGEGLGTVSVRALVQRLGGTVEFLPQAHTFRVTLMIPLEP